MPAINGRPRIWTFSNSKHRTAKIEPRPRIIVNDPLTIHRLVANGAGIGCVSGYLCTPDFKTGRLIHLLSEWTLPSVKVSVVFPSHRELAPGGQGIRGLYQKRLAARCVVARRGLTFTTPTYNAH
jgi:DNA-binding transcriptional LysR family regulator